MAGQAKQHQVPSAQRQVRLERPPLRYVADGRVATPGRRTQDDNRAGARPDLAEQQPQQGSLASAVGADQAKERALWNRDAGMLPDGATTQGHRDIIQDHRGNERLGWWAGPQVVQSKLQHLPALLTVRTLV